MNRETNQVILCREIIAVCSEIPPHPKKRKTHRRIVLAGCAGFAVKVFKNH